MRAISAWRWAISRPSGQLASGLLGAPGVPWPVEVARPAGLELEHRGANRLQEPAVVGDEHDRRVDVDQVLLEPLERLDVEVVGRLVQQQQVRLRRRARGPARRGSARRPRSCRAGGRARRRRSRGRAEPRSIAARASDSRPRARSRACASAYGPERPRPRRRSAIARLQLAELAPRSPAIQSSPTVTYSRRVELALARRALVVQRDPVALAERDRRRRRARPRRRASAAGSSCRAVAARTSVIRSPRSSLNETSLNSVRPPMCLVSPEAWMTGTGCPSGT